MSLNLIFEESPTILASVMENVREHLEYVQIYELGAREISIEVIDHCLDIVVEGKNKRIHIRRAATVGTLSENARYAAQRSNPRNRKLPSSKVIEALQSTTNQQG